MCGSKFIVTQSAPVKKKAFWTDKKQQRQKKREKWRANLEIAQVNILTLGKELEKNAKTEMVLCMSPSFFLIGTSKKKGWM